MIFLLPVLAAFLLCLIFTPATAVLAKKFGFVDDPRTHKDPGVLHKKIMPRAGGLPIFLSIVIAGLFIFEPTKQLVGIFLGGLILVATGLVDDKIGLKSGWGLLLQIISALGVVGFGVGRPIIF